MVWNKLNYSKDPETGKRRPRVNPSGKVITTAVPALRIVERLLHATADGKAVGSIPDRLADVAAKIVQLDRKLTDMPLPVPRLQPNLPEVYRRKVAALTDALSTQGRQPIGDGVRTLVDEIRLVPSGADLQIQVYGELPAITALGTGVEVVAT